MPWSDLSEVTSALIRLLELNIDEVLAPGQNVQVVPTPPDRLSGNVSNTLSLYLYRVRPSRMVGNFPNSAGAASAATPMALDLFYVLTAHHRSKKAADGLIEQRLIGYALKTLFDNPVLTDATRIAGQSVLTESQRGNSPLKIVFDDSEPEGPGGRLPSLAAYYRVDSVPFDR